MARTFSSIDSFNRSYFLKTLRNAGIAFFATRNSPTIRSGTTITNVPASAPPMIYAMVIEKTNISGHRIAVRISIM